MGCRGLTRGRGGRGDAGSGLELRKPSEFLRALCVSVNAAALRGGRGDAGSGLGVWGLSEFQGANLLAFSVNSVSSGGDLLPLWENVPLRHGGHGGEVLILYSVSSVSSVGDLLPLWENVPRRHGGHGGGLAVGWR
jgi:hypothetical protein